MTEPERSAIVTGGSRGIGLAIVTALAEAGWRVTYCGKTSGSLARAAGELARFGGSVAGRVVDIRRQEEVEAFVAWALGQAGRIDCLVNNAGLGTFGAIESLSGEQWRATIDTNLSGPFYAMRAVAPAMKERGEGWIINIASLAGKNAFAGGAAYNASKFGLVGLSEAAMLDLRGHGVRVATILPGSVDTAFGHPERRDDRTWMLAPEDVARTVLNLLAYPARALPSLVELRPSRPPKR